MLSYTEYQPAHTNPTLVVLVSLLLLTLLCCICRLSVRNLCQQHRCLIRTAYENIGIRRGSSRESRVRLLVKPSGKWSLERGVV